MAKKDYYEILGLSRGATPEEIKKSFRNRARQLHPDNKDSGDEAAFKELAEAYEVLSDEQKRATYDRYGHDAVKGSTRGFDNVDFSNFAGFGVDDFIDFFFGGGMRGGGARQGGPAQGSHLKYDLEIEFLEAVFGCDRKINIKRLEDCTTCEGSGATPGSEVTKCVTCAGMGQVQQVMESFFGRTMRVVECPACHGNGQKIDKPCRDCKGEGLVRKSREIALTIPNGIEPGTRLRLSRYGDKGRRNGTFGDLFVVVHVKEHKQFIRDGATIHIKQNIGIELASLGGELKIATVDGPRQLKIPAGIQSGTTVTMRDLGVPYFNNPGRRGDQIVHVAVETPSKLGPEERQLLEQLAELRGEKIKLSPEDASEIEASVEETNQKEKEKQAEAKAQKEKEKEEARAQKDKSKKDKDKDKSEDQKEDSSIFGKIVDAFRPKNGD